MDDDAALGQPVEILPDARAPGVLQHPEPDRRVRRVDAHVEWGQSLFEYAVPVIRTQVRQRDVVAVEEGQSVVVILHIEGRPKLVEFRVSLHEAERARVGAAADLVGLRDDPEGFVLGFLDLEEKPLAGLPLGEHPEFGFRLMKQKVEAVPNGLAVDLEHGEARRQFEVGGDRPRLHAGDSNHGLARGATAGGPLPPLGSGWRPATGPRPASGRSALDRTLPEPGQGHV